MSRSTLLLWKQMLKAGETNLSPQFKNVFLRGLLVSPEGVVMLQGANPQLNQLGQTLALQDTPIAGWVFLDPGLNV